MRVTTIALICVKNYFSYFQLKRDGVSKHHGHQTKQTCYMQKYLQHKLSRKSWNENKPLQSIPVKNVEHGPWTNDTLEPHLASFLKNIV